MYLNKTGSTIAQKVGNMLALALVLTSQAVMAQGLEKVNEFLENVQSVMHGAAIVVVSIAVMWAGYKFLFKHAGIDEIGKILGGGLLIGGAAEIAAWLVG